MSSEDKNILPFTDLKLSFSVMAAAVGISATALPAALAMA